MINSKVRIRKLVFLAVWLGAIVVPSKTLFAVVIDDFNYDKKAVSGVWQSVSNKGRKPPQATVAKGKPFNTLVTIFYCPFKELVNNEACNWQHDYEIDLSGHDALELDVYVENPEFVRNITLWLQTPGGWLTHKAQIEKQGWQTVTVRLSDFQHAEGEGRSAKFPEYFNAMRISMNPVKGQMRDTYIAISQLRMEKTIKQNESITPPVYNETSIESY
jgi:hypothetical protein